MKLKTFRFILIDFRSRFAYLVVETTDSSLFAIFLSWARLSQFWCYLLKAWADGWAEKETGNKKDWDWGY